VILPFPSLPLPIEIGHTSLFACIIELLHLNHHIYIAPTLIKKLITHTFDVKMIIVPEKIHINVMVAPSLEYQKEFCGERYKGRLAGFKMLEVSTFHKLSCCNSSHSCIGKTGKRISCKEHLVA
jgi:hypothetical protein